MKYNLGDILELNNKRVIVSEKRNDGGNCCGFCPFTKKCCDIEIINTETDEIFNCDDIGNRYVLELVGDFIKI